MADGQSQGRREEAMFDLEAFIADCRAAAATGASRQAIRRPRESGDPGASDRNTWVPAFAGKTD